MNLGVPPTARNARTGEFTPPGVTVRARSKRAADAGASSGYGLGAVGTAAGLSTAGVELTGPVSQVCLCLVQAARTGQAGRSPLTKASRILRSAIPNDSTSPGDSGSNTARRTLSTWPGA